MICGLSGKQAACDAEERALEHLARGKYRRELWECLAAFIDFRAAKSGPWNGSRTEAAALAHIEEGFLFQPCGTDKTGKGWAREDAAARSFVEWLYQHHNN